MEPKPVTAFFHGLCLSSYLQAPELSSFLNFLKGGLLLSTPILILAMVFLTNTVNLEKKKSLFVCICSFEGVVTPQGHVTVVFRAVYLD